MSSRNRWITFANSFFVRWGAFLPAPRGDVEAVVRLGTRIVDAGARHAVYRALRVPASRPYLASQESFEEYLRAEVARRAAVPLFPSYVPPGPELSTPARLAFYRGDALVEEEVEDVGALLRSLRPDEVEGSRMFMRGAAPVVVEGQLVPVDYAKDVRVQIQLHTDIWFPRVQGLLDDLPDDAEGHEMFDNRELASRHTPRFNAFLGEIRELVLELGGRFETLETDPGAENWASMWDERGIRL